MPARTLDGCCIGVAICTTSMVPNDFVKATIVGRPFETKQVSCYVYTYSVLNATIEKWNASGALLKLKLSSPELFLRVRLRRFSWVFPLKKCTGFPFFCTGPVRRDGWG